MAFSEWDFWWRGNVESLRARPQVGFTAAARKGASEFMKRQWANPEFRAKMAAIHSERIAATQVRVEALRLKRLAAAEERKREAQERRDAKLLQAALREIRRAQPPTRGRLLRELGPEGYAEWKRENARQMARIRVEQEQARGVSKTAEHRQKISIAIRQYFQEHEHPQKGKKLSPQHLENVRAGQKRRRERERLEKQQGVIP